MCGMDGLVHNLEPEYLFLWRALQWEIFGGRHSFFTGTYVLTELLYGHDTLVSPAKTDRD